MKVKLVTLVNAEAALGRLCAQAVSGKLAYHLARLSKVVAAETADYHKQRNALIQELGAEREATDVDRKQGFTGTVFEVTRKNLSAFNDRARELGDVEVEVRDWLLTLDQLGDCTLSGVDMLALEPLLQPEGASDAAAR